MAAEEFYCKKLGFQQQFAYRPHHPMPDPYYMGLVRDAVVLHLSSFSGDGVAGGVVYLAVEKVLGLKRDKTNVNGGAIALGHPLGASGTRLVITILNELRRNGLRYGLATACIGGGQGIAMIVEAMKN